MKAYNVWGEREGSFVWLTSSTNLATDTGPVVCRAALPLTDKFQDISFDPITLGWCEVQDQGVMHWQGCTVVDTKMADQPKGQGIAKGIIPSCGGCCPVCSAGVI